MVGRLLVKVHYFHWPFGTGGTSIRQQKPILTACKNPFSSTVGSAGPPARAGSSGGDARLTNSSGDLAEQHIFSDFSSRLLPTGIS